MIAIGFAYFSGVTLCLGLDRFAENRRLIAIGFFFVSFLLFLLARDAYRVDIDTARELIEV